MVLSTSTFPLSIPFWEFLHPTQAHPPKHPQIQLDISEVSFNIQNIYHTLDVRITVNALLTLTLSILSFIKLYFIAAAILVNRWVI